jgi:2-polyprenyl-6-methoxyphenol hydroxylase-like FAD-dependent oxidoreductase
MRPKDPEHAMSLSSQTHDYDVIVIGAGVGGTACALAMVHERNLRVLIIERHGGAGNINRGESLLPPITALLKRWNVLDRCREAGALPVDRMQFVHYRKGLLLDMPLTLPDISDPYLALPHQLIERALADGAMATGQVDILYSTRFLSLTETAGRVSGVVVRTRDGTEQRISCRVVVGADGMMSSVRARLGIELPRQRYGESLFSLDIDRPEGMPNVLRTEMHPDGGVLVVPGVNRLGLAALVRKEHQHLFRSCSIEEKFARIAQRSPLFRGRRPANEGAHLYTLWRGHAPRYFARGAVLLGDAVHVINPVMAQGMTMAIEDSAALGRWLGPTLESRGTPALVDASFAAYEKERRPFNARIIRSSHWMSRLFSLGGPWGDRVHRGAFALADSPLGKHIQDTIWASFAKSPEPAHG